MPRLLDDPPENTFIKDSLERSRARMAQIPEGKTAAFALALDWKTSLIPTLSSGAAYRTPKGWEFHGDGFISKVDKGASLFIVKTW